MVDLGGSLAVASKGLYATGVSTDLNGELAWPPMQVLSEIDNGSSSYISQFRRPSRRCLEGGCDV